MTEEINQENWQAAGYVIQQRTRAHSRALSEISTNSTSIINAPIQQEARRKNIPRKAKATKKENSAMKDIAASSIGIDKNQDRDVGTSNTAPQDDYEARIYQAALAHLKRRGLDQKNRKEKNVATATTTKKPAKATPSLIVKLKISFDPQAITRKQGNEHATKEAVETKTPDMLMNAESSVLGVQETTLGSQYRTKGESTAAPKTPKITLRLPKMKDTQGDIQSDTQSGLQSTFRLPGPKATFIRGSKSNPMAFDRSVRAVEETRKARIFGRGMRYFNGVWSDDKVSGHWDESGGSSPQKSSSPQKISSSEKSSSSQHMNSSPPRLDSSPLKRKRQVRNTAIERKNQADKAAGSVEMVEPVAKRVKKTKDTAKRGKIGNGSSE